MKSFCFRFEPALRWRNTQLTVQEGRVAAAASAVSHFEAQLAAIEAAVGRSAADARANPAAETLHAHAGFTRLAARHRIEIDRRLAEARRQLAAESSLRIEARRRQHLLQDLKIEDRSRWQGELDKETNAFAGEAHLLQLHQNKARSGHQPKAEEIRYNQTEHGGA